MKKIIKVILIMALTLNLSACGSNTESTKATYHKIDPGKAKEIMDSEENIVILDVRTPEEFEEERIANSVLLPDYEISQKASSTLTDKNQVILVYCRSGRRSEIAAKELVKLGFTNVYDFGGIIDWPFETVS